MSDSPKKLGCTFWSANFIWLTPITFLRLKFWAWDSELFEEGLLSYLEFLWLTRRRCVLSPLFIKTLCTFNEEFADEWFEVCLASSGSSPLFWLWALDDYLEEFVARFNKNLRWMFRVLSVSLPTSVSLNFFPEAPRQSWLLASLILLLTELAHLFREFMLSLSLTVFLYLLKCSASFSVSYFWI